MSNNQMSERESRIRSIVIVYFPMFIAALSLCTSIFNGYLNARFVDLIQNNVSRVEYLKTCKEIIDAYFQVKFRTGLLTIDATTSRQGGRSTADQVDAANAVNKFAALGTYLANLRGDVARARYTELTRILEKIVADAAGTSAADLSKRFEPADLIFTEMNEDCVKRSRDTPV